MLLVPVFQATQDRNRILDARLIDIDRLEPPGERGILLDVLLVFVERGCPNTVQFAPRERRLEQVGSVHSALGLAGPDECVHLVDEQDDAAVRRRHFLEHRFEPFLELSAIFRPGNQRAHVECEQFLVLQAIRHIAVDDALRQAFYDGGLANTWLPDQYRVVFGSAREDLNGAPNLLVTADDRIDLAVAGCLSEITRIFFQRLIGILSRACVSRAPLAQCIDCLIEVLRAEARTREDPSGLTILLERKREQQPLDGDVAIAGFFRNFLCLIKYARERRRQINLTSAAAGYFRKLSERRFHRRQRLARAAAGAIDQAAGQTLGIVEQNLEQVLGRELLVALAQSERLGGLNEPTGAVGVFFEIHISFLGLPLAPAARGISAVVDLSQIPARDQSA